MKKIKTILYKGSLFCLIFLWAFSGWPGAFAPKIENADAAVVTVALLSGQTTWTVPADWSNTNTIEVWGAGGGGRSSSSKSGGGGGGGYSKIVNTTALTAGQTVGVNVSTLTGGIAPGTDGDNTWVCNSQSNCTSLSDSAVIVGAEGGKGGPSGGAAGTGGSGGLAVNGIGATKYSGGNGGTGTQNGGNGGGGGAAGPNGDGENGGSGDSTAAGDDAGGGGGGAGGASSTVGADGTTAFGAGGHGPGGTGGGATAGANGSSATGGGGAGGAHGAAGGNGANYLIGLATGVNYYFNGGGGGGGNGGNGGHGDFDGTSGSNTYRGGGGGGGATGGSGAGGIIFITYTQEVATQLGDGTDPSNLTIAPSASATEIDRFSFKTTTGTDTVTGLTVTLAPANAYTNVATIDVQTTGGASKCSTTPSSNTVTLASCAIAVTTTLTEYKIMLTPKTHANMPVPASGASYDTTATVTGWEGTNTTKTGTDTDSAAITIDNLSPANVTSASAASSLESQVSISWTNPGDSDFDNVIVLQRASSAVADTPTEGSTYATSSTIGSSTVVCSGLVTSCTVTSLSSSTAYHYKIFTRDTRNNWSDSGAVPTGSPVTPSAATLSLAAYRFFEAANSYTPGTALAVQNTTATLVSSGQPFRMRALVHVDENGISSSGRVMKLQYAPQAGACDATFTGEVYHDVSATTTIAYRDTPIIEDNTALGAQADLTHGSDTIVNQTYEEANTFTNSQGSILSGQDGKWDFSLIDNGGTAGSSYCMRLVTDTETTFTTYTVVPEIIMASAGAPELHQLHYRWRKDNVSEASTSFTEAEDTQLNTSSVQIGDRVRLRVLISNTGQSSATDYKHKLEYSSGACSAWSTIPNDSESGPWRMSLSTRVLDEATTADNTGLTNPDGLSFVAGVVKSASSTTAVHTLAANEFTEIEYVIRSTLNAATGTTYCFKVTNEGSTTNYTYDVTPSLVLPANAVRPQSGGSSSAVEAPASPSIPQTGGSEGGGGGTEGGGGGAPAGGGNEGGGGGGDLGTITRNLASILDNIKSLLIKIR